MLPYYAGQVKCIYIDPPYNTGNEKWVYNDNVNSPEIRKWLGKVVGGEMEDLSRHDKWLCMMYPRLALLRKMLREDGTIFISIDDNEKHHLRAIMDEIFGEKNFIATVIWQKEFSPQKFCKAFISESHDYILTLCEKCRYLEAKFNSDDRKIKIVDIKTLIMIHVVLSLQVTAQHETITVSALILLHAHLDA